MTKKETVRSYDIWVCWHGTDPVVRTVIREPNIDAAYMRTVALAGHWFPQASISKAGTGKTAMLVREGVHVLGTVAIEPTSRRPAWIRVEDEGQ